MQFILKNRFGFEELDIYQFKNAVTHCKTRIRLRNDWMICYTKKTQLKNLIRITDHAIGVMKLGSYSTYFLENKDFNLLKL